MSRMAPRTAPLHLRYAESSTAAGSAIAAINAHSGRGVVRPPRSFLAHRPLGRLFFRFAGPIACSSRQNFAPLSRRPAAAWRPSGSADYSRYPTLSPLSPSLSSVPSSAPLRLHCADRGASSQAGLQFRRRCLLPVLMTPCAPPSQIEHHRVIESGVGVCVDLCRSRTPTQSPAHPKPAAVGIAKARPRLSAHAYRQAREATPAAVAGVKFTWRLLGIIDAFFGVFLRFDAQRDSC
jgi:hypothetical protein